MQLLTILTLIYVAILVLALAASLIMILVYLRRISGVLGDVHAALERVTAQTGPLEQSLQGLDEVVAGPTQKLHQAVEKMKAAEEHLNALVEQFGPLSLKR
jgi:uncharacterized protein YoxC